jgi:hypothetical protein
VYLQDINIRKKEEMNCKFKMGYLEEVMSLSFYPHGGHEYVNMSRRRSTPIVDYGGAIHETSSNNHNKERHSIFLRLISSSSISSGMHKAKLAFLLIGFISYRSRGVVGRQVYSIVGCTIKRSLG